MGGYDNGGSDLDALAAGGCSEPSSIAETFRGFNSNPGYNPSGHGNKRINEAAQLLTMDDLNALFDIFTKADQSGDGVCSREELIQTFDLQNPDDYQKVELMMHNLDENGNGEVDFAEFVNWGA